MDIHFLFVHIRQFFHVIRRSRVAKFDGEHYLTEAFNTFDSVSEGLDPYSFRIRL